MIRSLRQIFCINYDRIRFKKVTMCRAARHFEGVIMLKRMTNEVNDLNVETINNEDSTDINEVKDELEILKREVRKCRPLNFAG